MQPPRRHRNAVEARTGYQPEVRRGSATPTPGPVRHRRAGAPGHRAAADPPWFTGHAL